MKGLNMKKTLMTLLVTLIVTQSVSAMTLTELVDVVRRSATESSAENKQRVE